MEIGDGEYSFNTIYLYIILKLLALPTRLFLVLIPYIFTSFSNTSAADCSRLLF